MKVTWMKPRAARLAPLLLAGLLLGSLPPARAGILDGLFGGGGEGQKASPGQRLWVVREFSEIRIVPREAGAAANQHPAQLSPETLRQQLAQIRFATGKGMQPLFTRDEADELSEPLTQALASAGPAEDVLLLSSARRSDAVMFRPVAVTARVFVQSGGVQLIVNDARFEFYDLMRGSQRTPEFTYGSRTRTGHAVLQAESATAVRADWLVLPLVAATAAPATAVAPAPVRAAPAAVPAPAAPAPQSAAPPPRPRDPGFADEIEQRLTTLKRLRERGLISEEEYQQKRKEILQLL